MKLSMHRVKIFCLVSVVLFSGIRAASQDRSWSTIADAENRFADRAAETGTREAFLAFAADDGLMLNSKPENAKQSFEKRPANNSFLNWRPAWVDIAASGDIGYSTGPWSFSKSKADPPNAWGEFFTIWKKQSDGAWKFALDLGISHHEAEVISVGSSKSPDQAKESNAKTTTAESWRTIERSFAESLADKGTKKTYERFASNQIRLLREGQFPFQGKPAALAFISSDKISFAILGGESRSDFAYAYGEYEIRDKDVGIRKGFFARVWKLEPSGWRIAAEVANLLPSTN